MNVLFVHNNFPAQFVHAARALARDPSVKVAAVGSQTARAMPGVQLKKYSIREEDVSATHPFARRFEMDCRRAEQVLYGASSLAATGFVPDVIVAHPGWGETLPLRTVFPQARLLVYCEFFYGPYGRDLNFDPEFPNPGLDGNVAAHLKNATTLLALNDGDRGVSPTRWQRSTYPAAWQDKIDVIHEGVDVDLAKPDPSARFRLPSGRELTRADEVVTFVARNLEPLRGYHIFMRSLPRILARRPSAHAVIVGGDETSYGMRPPKGTTWKQRYYEELAGEIDPARIHFTGRLPYDEYLSALQVSSAHVYFTYPFVLSWSLIEAMSAGCLVIGSDTAPVREALDAENGIIVPFFDVEQLSDRVVDTLAHPERYRSVREAARETALRRYDLNRVCLPQMLSLIRSLEPARPPSRSQQEAAETPPHESAVRPSPHVAPEVSPPSQKEPSPSAGFLPDVWT